MSKKVVAKKTVKKSVAPAAKVVLMRKTKIARNIGLRVGKDHTGKEIYDNVFYNVDSALGTEVELTDSQYRTCQNAIKAVLKAQEILRKAVGE